MQKGIRKGDVVGEEKRMERHIGHYWHTRLEDLKGALEGNNFEAFIAEDVLEASSVVQEKILPKTGARSVSWGGSMTFVATGLYDNIKGNSNMKVLDTFNRNISPEEALELRRKALLVDLFISGTNAVTETGELVNLDMHGNRVAAITFGPKHVVILVGRNKIVPDIEAAIARIKNYAAPVNAMRLNKKTPCVKASYCDECKAPDRICNTWTITKKSFPKGRIKVVLINRDLGL